jgi:creatinine deaminase
VYSLCSRLWLSYIILTTFKSENKTFLGGEEYLKSRGVEVIVVDNAECKSMMDEFIAKNPEEWSDVICDK